MKVVVATPYFPPHRGGLENYSFNHSKQLQARMGWEVKIVTGRPGLDRPRLEEVEGLEVLGLPIFATLSNTPVHPRWLAWMRDFLRSERPDVVNAHTPVPGMADVVAAVRGRLPLVVTYHNDLVKQGRVSKLVAEATMRTMISRTLRVSDRIVATSRSYAERSPLLQRHLPKVRILPPGVETERFNRRVDRSWLGARHGSRRPLLLFVGSLGPSHRHKGLEVLLAALVRLRERHPDLLLVVVGGGDDRSARRAVQAHGLTEHVAFAGFVDDNDLPTYFAGADVCCLPSLSAAEGFGMVLAESMACGTPVVGSRVGGITSLLEATGGGILAEPGDATSFARSIDEVLGSPSRWSALADQGAQAVADELSWSALAVEHDRILRELLSG